MISTERLIMTPITMADLNSYHDSTQDMDVMRYIGYTEVPTYAHNKSFFEKKIAFAQIHKGYGMFRVCLKDGTYIGNSNLNQLEQTNKIHLGYRLMKKFWGFGYATEISKSLVNYGFEIQKMSVISAVVDLDHKASQNILIKSGFKFIEITKDYYNTELKYYEISRIDYIKYK